MRKELEARLLADLEEDADYKEDVIHSQSTDTHTHSGGTKPNEWSYDDPYCSYCGSCGTSCCYAALARYTRAREAVHDYVYGGYTIRTNVPQNEREYPEDYNPYHKDGTYIYTDDAVFVDNTINIVGRDEEQSKILTEYATLKNRDIVFLAEIGKEGKAYKKNANGTFSEYTLKVGDVVVQDDENYYVESAPDNKPVLKKFSEKYSFYSNGDIIKINGAFYKISINGTNISFTNYTEGTGTPAVSSTQHNPAVYYEDGIKYESTKKRILVKKVDSNNMPTEYEVVSDNYVAKYLGNGRYEDVRDIYRYEAQSESPTHNPIKDGDVVVALGKTYKFACDATNGASMTTYTPSVTKVTKDSKIEPDYVVDAINPDGKLEKSDGGWIADEIPEVSYDNVIDSLYLGIDNRCQIPYYKHTNHSCGNRKEYYLKVDYWFSVWDLYNGCDDIDESTGKTTKIYNSNLKRGYKDNPIHLNDLATIYTTRHEKQQNGEYKLKEMKIEIKEMDAPDGYLKWNHDNKKYLYLIWDLGEVVRYHYDREDNDSREVEYTAKRSNQHSLKAVGKDENGKPKEIKATSSVNNMTWTLPFIELWDAKDEDIVKFIKRAELANGETSNTKVMDGVKFTIKIDTVERLDGNGIAEGGVKSESWTVQKTTDSNGYIGITSRELQEHLGIDVISRWIGEMTITYTEVDLGKYTPYYEKWFTPRTVTIEFNGSEHETSLARVKGEQEEKGEDAITNGTRDWYVLTDGYDTPSAAPQMIIKKTDMAGNALKGAEFDVTIKSDRGDSVHLGKCVTNEAGQYMIYPSDLRGLGITTMNRWTGDLTLIARETKAPDKYTNLNEGRDIVATIHVNHGKIVPSGTSISQGSHVEWSIHNTWYEDQQHWEGSSPTFVLSVKNSIDNNLLIRKIEANTENQDYIDDKYLNEARFDVTIKNGNNSDTRKAKLDSKGYFVIIDNNEKPVMTVTQLADRIANGDLGQFTGTLEVTIKEIKTPAGYIAITDPLTVKLNYKNGHYQGAEYKNDTSKVVLDVGKSDDETDVTIAVKNTKENLQPIYIQKIDPTTNTSVKGVSFDITISKTKITEQNSIKSKTYTTGNEGMIAITTDELNKIGIKNDYKGELYVLIEEVSKEDGYTMLEGPVYVYIRYENGSIKEAKVLKGDGATTLIDKNGTGMLKITVNNPWEIPDIEIAKETLTNGETHLIDEATFDITLTANNGKSFTETHNVSKAGKILFDSKTIESKLGINGSYTGDIKVYISEINVRNDAAIVDEGFTVTLTYEKGKMVESNVENKTHASVVKNDAGTKVTIMVNDSIIIPNNIFLGGYVWEEKATTKSGLLKDGIYTEMSDSEHTDKMLEGIEVSLYRKDSDGTLKFVDSNVAGTNPTLTDKNGYYEFEVPGLAQYVVKFTYNGQAYEDVAVDTNSQIYSYDWSSKGTEVSQGSEARQTINNKYNEIGSYPANYKVEDLIIIRDDAGSHFPHAENGDIYNISYRDTEISEVREKVAIETSKYLGKHKYINKNNDKVQVNKEYAEIYRNVIENYYLSNGQLTDPEIYNKLQYIHDSRISAVAGTKTESYELTDFANLGSYNETYKYINLAIVKRDMVDLTISKDAYSSTVSINRKDTIYDYNKSADKYTLLNYEEDYNYNTAPNSNGLAYYKGGEDEAELYLTYKVTVKNEKKINTQLTEIVDYFDSKFGYKDQYTTSSGASIQGIRAYKLNANGERVGEITSDLDTSRNGTKGTSKTGRYITASRIGLVGNPYLTDNKAVNPDYSELFVTFAKGKEPNLGENEGVEFYITIKLGKGEEVVDREGTKKVSENYLIAPKYHDNKDRAMDILKEAINDPKNFQKTMQIYNYAEINGYMTYQTVTEKEGQNGEKVYEYSNPKGYFDDDSKPGTFVVKDFTDILAEYRKAFMEVQKKPSKENREKFSALLEQVNKMRGDDTWAVELDIMNNLNDNQDAYYHRSLNGNVWEAVNDQVKTSTDLYRNELLTYIEKNGIQGIPVELVELEPDGDQIVRAKTITDKNGKYEFTGFIPGDYTVRFIYGAEKRDGYNDKQNDTMNDTSRNGYNDVAKNRGVNGQYYQSTKANPNTDKAEYWYAKDIGTRYSDAYDEVTARIEQIESQTKSQTDAETARNTANRSTVNVDNSWSWDYEWDGIFNAETRSHIDQMEAYTSTMQFEVENTKVQLEGDQGYDYYRYKIDNIDFGLTPRAEADLKIDEYVSNIKLYLADNTNNANGTLQLDVDLSMEGGLQKLNYKNDALFNNAIIPTSGENNNSYRDGLLEVLYDTQLLNGATLEVTYTITVSNEGEANTITYYYDGNEIVANGGKITGKLAPIAHSYYNGHGEELSNLMVFEADRNKANIKLDKDNAKVFEDITYHPTTVYNGDYGNDSNKTNTYKRTNYTVANDKEITNTVVKHNTNGNKARLTNNDDNKYEVKEAANPVIIDVRTRATNIIDYVDPNLNFTQTKVSGEPTNLDWELTDISKFNSTREVYDGSQAGKKDVMSKYNNILRAVGGETYTNYKSYLAAVALNVEDMVWTRDETTRPNYSELYMPLLTREDVDGNVRTEEGTDRSSISTTLTLSKVLQTSSTDTNDYEYSNLVELTRMENYTGKIIDLENYDIEGDARPETSEKKDPSDIPELADPEPPTMGTSKSETIVIHEPTGLSITEAPKANLGIILVVLIILAGGIILIKKFVLTPKNN